MCVLGRTRPAQMFVEIMFYTNSHCYHSHNQHVICPFSYTITPVLSLTGVMLWCVRIQVTIYNEDDNFLKTIALINKYKVTISCYIDLYRVLWAAIQLYTAL